MSAQSSPPGGLHTQIPQEPDSPIPLAKFKLSPPEVKALMVQYELTAQQLLVKLVKAGGSMARPPISGFHVG